MKKITILMASFAMASAVFAQIPNCPTSVKRNNGNGGNQSGLATFTFATCPLSADIIDSIYVNGSKADMLLDSTATISCGAQKNEVSYKIVAGNWPPTGTWVIYFSQIAFGGNSYNCTLINGGGGPLPVSLASFNARRIKNNVEVTWSADLEENLNYYEIQSAVVGQEFSTVGTVNAGGTYTFIHTTPRKGTLQYRLKMVDLDGSFAYSEVRTLRGQGSITDFKVFPNPSNGEAKVAITDISENMDVQVLDNAGRVIKSLSMKNTSQVNINGLQKGMYMVRIVNKATGEVSTQKLTVVN
jgi:hypothetical protein